MPDCQTFRGVCLAAECDEMEHMGVRHFAEKLSQAAAQWDLALGLSPAVLARLESAVRPRGLHMRFHREVRAGDLLEIVSGHLTYGPSDWRAVHVLRPFGGGPDFATFVLDNGLSHRVSAQPVPLPETVQKAAGERQVTLPDSARPRAFVSAFPTPAPTPMLEPFESMRGMAGAGGHQGASLLLPSLVGMVVEAQHAMWAAAGLHKRDMIERGFATATAELRVLFQDALKAGEPFHIRTSIEPAKAGTKSVRFRHEIYRSADQEPVLAAEGAGFVIDRTTRKAVDPAQGAR